MRWTPLSRCGPEQSDRVLVRFNTCSCFILCIRSCSQSIAAASSFEATEEVKKLIGKARAAQIKAAARKEACEELEEATEVTRSHFLHLTTLAPLQSSISSVLFFFSLSASHVAVVERALAVRAQLHDACAARDMRLLEAALQLRADLSSGPESDAD